MKKKKRPLNRERRIRAIEKELEEFKNRKPRGKIPPPSFAHEDKACYNRKQKHKTGYLERENNEL